MKYEMRLGFRSEHEGKDTPQLAAREREDQTTVVSLSKPLFSASNPYYAWRARQLGSARLGFA